MKRLICVGFLAALAGCGGPSYQDQRPPLDELDPRDRGLQSKDVLSASDRLAMDLLQVPELNQSGEQWTVVVRPVEDQTSSRGFRGNYDVFIRRLRTNLAQQARGRIQLVENRERFYQARESELDQERDDFGQGDGRRPGAESRIQPDFALNGVARDMPNRGTNYYFLEFDLVDLHSGAIVWNGAYDVRVAR